MTRFLSRFQTPSKLPGLFVLLALLILGIFIHDDYGVGWDEVVQREIGVVNLQVARSGDESHIAAFINKDHGAAFELPLLVIEKILKPADFGDMIIIRHTCGYLFYITGIFCGYLLALRIFRKQWIALLGMVMLLLQPRIFAHAFFNSKDVPFLAAMLIALFAISAALEHRKLYLFLLAGAACGFATGIRTMGLLPALVTGMMLLRDVYVGRGTYRRRTIVNVLAFGVSSLLALYLSWPALWHHPVESFTYTVLRLSRYTAWGGRLLFNGQSYPASVLPWYYIPQWFAMSTPVIWVLLGLSGMAFGLARIIRAPRSILTSLKGRMLFICATCFFLPLLSVIVLHSVLYDDWRHLYFIYPPFVMLALHGADRFAAVQRAKTVVIAACGLQGLATTAFMVSAHPQQQVYFNALVPHSPEYLRGHFDYDYWGVSYGQGLRYILDHDRRDTIVIVNSDSPLEDNGYALPEQEQKRIRWTRDLEHGAYFLATFRYHPEDYPWPKVWGVKVGNSTVLQIYRVDSAMKP